MTRMGLAIAVAALAAASGCSPDSDKPATPSAADAAAERKILAVEPPDMTQEASRRPAFRWRLPPSLRSPSTVTFKLFEVGRAEDPRKAAAQEKQVALGTSLAEANSTGFDPFKPQPPAVLTGDILDMKQLAPDTWYHWRIRIISDLAAADADFYFRTRTDDAVPTAAKP
jgi:hypothetical protein